MYSFIYCYFIVFTYVYISWLFKGTPRPISLSPSFVKKFIFKTTI